MGWARSAFVRAVKFRHCKCLNKVSSSRDITAATEGHTAKGGLRLLRIGHRGHAEKNKYQHKPEVSHTYTINLFGNPHKGKRPQRGLGACGRLGAERGKSAAEYRSLFRVEKEENAAMASSIMTQRRKQLSPPIETPGDETFSLTPLPRMVAVRRPLL